MTDAATTPVVTVAEVSGPTLRRVVMRIDF
jgi:hypothetical protein